MLLPFDALDQPDHLAVLQEGKIADIGFSAAQDERVTDPEECRRDCLETVRGWSSEITQAIESTPLERITRSRVADRYAARAAKVYSPWSAVLQALQEITSS